MTSCAGFAQILAAVHFVGQHAQLPHHADEDPERQVHQVPEGPLALVAVPHHEPAAPV